MSMSGASAVGGSGVEASATSSTGFASGAGTDCYDSPHPTSTKAAIVVIRYFMDALFVMRRSQLFKPD